MGKSKCMFAALAMVLSIIGSASIAEAATVLMDDFNGNASVGIVNGVTFTEDTAVFDSADDGIEYPSSLFAAQGTMEVLLRVDLAGLYIGSGQFPPGSAILDSAGADARMQGDIFLKVLGDTGIVEFTLAPVGGVNPALQVQVSSTTSIIDGEYHSVAVSYGSEGIKLFIDCTLEDSDPFTGLRNTNRPVSLADFTDRFFNDSSYQFGFIGEVDAIRTSTVQSDFTFCPSVGPIANAGPDQVVFDEVTLDGGLSTDEDGIIISWEWNLIHRTNSAFDRTAIGVTPIVRNLSPGFYNVNLKVTNEVGSTDTDSMFLVAAGTCPISPIPDEDEDGEPDSNDLCSGTLLGEDVDSDGCSLSQFCAAIDTNIKHGKKMCDKSDWRNDEPLENKGDCEAIKQGKGPSNYQCVPR